MRSILVILISSLAIHAQAQLLGVDEPDLDKASYFVSFDFDTIYGEVEYMNTIFSRKMNKVRFIDDEGYIYVLRAKESSGFCMNGVQYKAKMVDEFFFFLRESVSGYPGLYYVEKNFEEKERNMLNMMRMTDPEPRVINRFLDIHGRMNKMYMRRFKKQAPRLFSEYPEVVEMIEKEEFTYDDLEEIVTFCNYTEMEP